MTINVARRKAARLLLVHPDPWRRHLSRLRDSSSGRRNSATSRRSPRPSTGSAFPGVLLPTGQNCEDSWITATGLAAHTERLKYPRRAAARRRLAGLRGAPDGGARPAEQRPAAAQRRRRRQSGRARRRRRLHAARRALRAGRRVPDHLARPAVGRDRSTSTANTTASRAAGSTSCRCRSRCRRSISAARPMPARISPPSRSTST